MTTQPVISEDGSPRLDESAIEGFRAQLRGVLLLPADAGYDDARTVWNEMTNRHPALIARCAGAADVIAAVNFAREQELLVSVRGGGHNVAGSAVCGDDGLMIDLSLMKSIRVDPDARTARAEPGLTWGEFDRETQAFGLATVGGVVGTTGIAGLTLGGGFGWLTGKHGLACDNLLSADVVMADGRLLTASAGENEDLFWALRGGGGNFGIVTSFEYQLHPLGEVLAGPVFHPAERGPEVLRFYREFAANAPDELTTYCGFLTDPDGNDLAAIVVCYAGDLEEGERVIEPLRKFGPPIADMIGPMPYTALQSMFNEAFAAGRLNYWKSSLVDELSDEVFDTILEHVPAKGSPLSMLMIEQFHGAYNRVDPTATAYPHRDASYNIGIYGCWTDPAESDAFMSWARGFAGALRPNVPDKVYSNYLDRDDGSDRVRDAFGANYDRLVEVKNKYDPTNFFRLNNNIKPSV